MFYNTNATRDGSFLVAFLLTKAAKMTRSSLPSPNPHSRPPSKLPAQPCPYSNRCEQVRMFLSRRGTARCARFTFISFQYFLSVSSREACPQAMGVVEKSLSLPILPAKTTSMLTGLLIARSSGTTGTTTATSGVPGLFSAIHPHRWGSKWVVLFSYNRESAFLPFPARFWHLICEVNSSLHPHRWGFCLVFLPLPPTGGGQRDLFLFFRIPRLPPGDGGRGKTFFLRGLRRMFFPPVFFFVFLSVRLPPGDGGCGEIFYYAYRLPVIIHPCANTSTSPSLSLA
jgi:hypothetical protein